MTYIIAFILGMALMKAITVFQARRAQEKLDADMAEAFKGLKELKTKVNNI